MAECVLRELNLADLREDFLSGFHRRQETRRVWYIEDGEWKQKDDFFIDEWDGQKKQLVIEDLKNCVRTGGSVVGAYDAGMLIGFANVEGTLFGSKGQYLELPYIHISSEHRGKGIGKKLFASCCRLAREKGAKKLYIAAHPSVETQQFYRSVGCVLAAEINPRIYEKEPLDIQLERVL